MLQMLICASCHGLLTLSLYVIIFSVQTSEGSRQNRNKNIKLVKFYKIADLGKSQDENLVW